MTPQPVQPGSGLSPSESSSAPGDAVIVLDAQSRIVSWNRAAARLLGASSQKVSGLRLADLADARHIVPADILAAVQAPPLEGTRRTVTTLTGSTGRARTLEFSVSGLGEGKTEGVLLVIRDTTPAASVAPICTHCKSVGDGQGAWQPIEAYVSKHTGTTLRQEMCPACMRVLYPELCREERPTSRTAEAA